MFQLTDVRKSFGGVPALHPLTLSLPAGRTTVLLGPSGCGKSTLLRLFTGLVQPDTGSVAFDGEPITPKSAPALRRRIGFMVQDGGLFPHLTARGNVLLLGKYLRRDQAFLDRRLGELIELTHFAADRLDLYPAQLSGGLRQRVSLMRALLLDPDVLLLDEPLGALDPLIRSELQADLREIFRSLNKTVVLVTHDLGEAAFLADEIVLLQGGRMVQRGRFADLLERPADPFVTRFVNASRLPEAPAEPRHDKIFVASDTGVSTRRS
jgi:osmoprotectant transport system ATP-binding protein